MRPSLDLGWMQYKIVSKQKQNISFVQAKLCSLTKNKISVLSFFLSENKTSGLYILMKETSQLMFSQIIILYRTEDILLKK